MNNMTISEINQQISKERKFQRSFTKKFDRVMYVLFALFTAYFFLKTFNIF